MAERDLVVRFIGDERDLNRAFSNQTRQVAAFDARLTGLGRTAVRTAGVLGVAFGAREVFRGLNASVDAASDLNEQISRTRIVLGDAADDAIAWSKTTADSMGISQRAALSANAVFAGLFQTVGLLPAEAGQLSQSLVKLAADLASLQNTSPEEALIALRSGLVGEAEPLRRYNIFLSEARVAQVAMARTGKQNAAALTDQERALARYTIILQDSAPAQGNFAQTSGELANQSRILDAQLDDLSANIGQVFVPAVTAGVTGLNEFIDAMERGVVRARNLRDAIRDVDFDFPDPPGWLSNFVLSDDVRDLLFDDGNQAGDNALEGFADSVQSNLERVADSFRRAGEDSGNAFVDGLQATTARLEGQIAGLGESITRARIAGDQGAELAALRAQQQRLQQQLEIQEQIVARGGTGAATARRRIRQQILPALLSVTNAINSILDERDREIENTRRRAAESKENARRKFAEMLDLRREQAELERQLRQGRQFEALGLTASGEERVPGVGALRRRLRNLEGQLEGTTLDTSKTRAKLERIRRVLSGEFGKVGRDVRNSILQMLNDISSALDQGGGQQGPLTKFQKTGIEKLIEGLGLSEEQIKELRQRMARVGRGGTTPGTGVGAFGMNVTTGGGDNIIIENKIYLDGEQVANNTTKHQQRTSRRRTSPRRGTGAGR